jgi:penicillin G amidase
VKHVFYFVCLVSLTLVLAIFLQVRQLTRTLPNYTQTHTSAHLSQTVEIVRDAYAIPHIFASTEADAAFGLGYAHAQDRMWQMEMSRRIVSGRISEIIGSRGLTIDTWVRTAGLYDLAGASYPHLNEPTRDILDAYALGVNTAIEKNAGELSPEFNLLGLALEPWTPQDSIAVFKMLSVGLSGNMISELRRVELLSRLSLEQLLQFAPPYPGDDPIRLPKPEDLYPGYAPDAEQTALQLPPGGPVEASNNWVVNGSRTKSGKPLLSNDPHLSFSAPSIWYLAHTGLADANIVGGTMPGMPLTLAGRTERIAWGLTNTGPDVQDLYLEKVNPANPNQYQTPDGWAEFETRQEFIKVRFGKDVNITVRSTRHGPVLPDTFSEGPFPPQGYVLALKWTALTPMDRSLDAQTAVPWSADWKAFNEAFRPMNGPMQNIVYADVDGNIGFVAPALVPVRGPNHQTNGLMPAPGWLSENDWQSYIPFENWPRFANPPSGRIATANSKITPVGYTPFITSEWGSPFRTVQIEKRLEEKPLHDVASFQEMHTDNTSLVAQALLPHLMSTPATSEGGLKLLNTLDGWDGVLRAKGPEGLLYSEWAQALGYSLYADELGDLYETYMFIRPAFLISIFSGDTKLSKWCDNINTSNVETCDEILTRALDLAAQNLERRYGPDFDKENWGDHHKVIHSHMPFSNLPILKRYFSIEVTSGGGPFTPNQGAYQYSSAKPFQNRHGAGYRAVYDLSDFAASRYIQTTGQSGNVFSKHYKDMAPLWESGELIPIQSNRDDVREGAIGITNFSPQ